MLLCQAVHVKILRGHTVYVSCSPFKSETETVVHLFWNCQYGATFWKEVRLSRVLLQPGVSCQ